MVDGGESQAAAYLWVEGGTYDVGGGARLGAYRDLVHQDLIHTGAAA